jgi:hypothetical protein
MRADPEPKATPPTPEPQVRLAIAQLVMLLGGLGSIAGAAMIIIGWIRASIDGNEGGAMQAAGGIVLLVPALVILGVGLLLRPRRGTGPPSDPRA